MQCSKYSIWGKGLILWIYRVDEKKVDPDQMIDPGSLAETVISQQCVIN